MGFKTSQNPKTSINHSLFALTYPPPLCNLGIQKQNLSTELWLCLSVVTFPFFWQGALPKVLHLQLPIKYVPVQEFFPHKWFSMNLLT